VFIPLSQTLTLAVAGNYQSLTHHDKHLMPMARPYIALRGISRYRYQGDYVATAQTQLAWRLLRAGSCRDSLARERR
jgi:hypothetical protein